MKTQIIYIFLIATISSLAGDFIPYVNYGNQPNFILSDSTEKIEADNFDLMIDKKDKQSYDYFFKDEEGFNRQELLRKVFSDLSRLIVPEGDYKVVYKITITNQNNGIPATARQIYHINYMETEGIIEGAVWLALNTGRKPYQYVNDNIDYFGEITINSNFEFNFDFDSKNFNEYDLYSILLHEIIHSLGFGSFITSKDINKKLEINNFFTRYDTYLYLKGNDEIKLIEDYLNPELNKKIETGNLVSYCDAAKSQIIFKTSEENNILIYAPESWIDGSSLSHIEHCSGENKEHVMHPTVEKGWYKRYPSEEEVEILNDLGYNISGVYGWDDGSTRYKTYSVKNKNLCVVRNDFFADSTQAPASIDIAYNDIVANDFNVDRIDKVEILSTPKSLEIIQYSLNSSDTLKLTGDFDFIGEITLKYYASNSETFSNPGYIVIKREDKTMECYTEYNLICNPGAEQTWQYFGFDPPCEREITQAWNGFSGEIYSRNADILPLNLTNNGYFLSCKIPFYSRFQQNSFYSIQNPDTWDSDKNNIFYLGHGIQLQIHDSARTSYSDNKLFDRYKVSETIFQNLNGQLDKNLKYILDFRFFSSNKMLVDGNFDSTSVYVLLTNENICSSWDNYFSFNYLDTFEIVDVYPPNSLIVYDEKHNIDGKWKHIKSKPIKIDTTYKYINFAANVNNLDSYYLEDFKWDWIIVVLTLSNFYDDIYLREAFASVNMLVSNYTPCVGETVDFEIEIWKDDPEMDINFILEKILPEGLIYVGGDFTQDGNKLVYQVKNENFNEDDKIFLTISVAVSDSIKTKSLINKLSIAGKPDEFTESLGKTSLELRPNERNIEIKKKYENPLCKGKPIRVEYEIYNTAKFSQQLEFIIQEDERFSIIDSTIRFNDTKISKYEDESFYYNSGYNLNYIYINDFPVLSNGNDMGGMPSATISFEMFTHSTDSLYFGRMEVKPDFGCSYIFEDTLLFTHQKPELILEDYYFACDSLILELRNTNLSAKWSTGSDSLSTVVKESGIYYLEVTDIYNCSYFDTINVEIDHKYEIYFAKDIIKIKNQRVYSDIEIFITDDNFKEDFKGTLILSAPKKFVDIANQYELISENDSITTYKTDINIDILNNKELLVRSLGLNKKMNSSKTEKIIATFISSKCQKKYTDTLYLVFEPMIEGSEIIDKFSENFEIIGYPNPNSGNLKIDIQIPYTTKIELKIIDILGNTRMQIYKGVIEAGAYELNPDISDFSPGIYYIELQLNSQKNERFKIQVIN